MSMLHEEDKSKLVSSSKIDVLVQEKPFFDDLIIFKIQNYKNYKNYFEKTMKPI